VITYMTPSRIEYEYQGQSYTVHGEALNSDIGGLDYVIYANDMHFTDESRKDESIDQRTKLALLDGIKAELLKRGTRFEVEGIEYMTGLQVGSPARVPAPGKCPQDGFWFTPARLNSRRAFRAGEVMPDVGGDYGITIWQWDETQS
jgi:hypothetical protein